MADIEFNTEFKEASEHMKSYNKSVADKFGIDFKLKAGTVSSHTLKTNWIQY